MTDWQKQLRHICDNITALTEIPCVAAWEYQRNPAVLSCLCAQDDVYHAEKQHLHQHALEQAAHQQGIYVYRCSCGCAFAVALPKRAENSWMSSLIAGPFLIEQHGDIQLPVLTPKQAQALAETMRLLCSELENSNMMSSQDSNIQEEMLQEMYLTVHKENKSFYSLKEERKLQQLIRTGSKQEAQQQLNHLLLDLYAMVGTDLALLKQRIGELITLMSRAAADGGADASAVFALCDRSARELEYLADFDTVDAWLGAMLHTFFDMLFDFPDAPHQTIIQQAAAYIKEHLSEKVSLEQVANEVHLSKSYLCRILKEELGCTFTEYTNKLRVEKSKMYLHCGEMSLSEIACAVGFDDQSYFTRVFRRQVGVPPGKYRAGKTSA
ncbi:helix-turn-helix transcriptional regulator [Butyricicoccus sp.]|uniref:helix-turn-helix transcriptional regulator n=1 Tax=Butyricicoccus sp. TaxID=2049021 RepID=UPI003AAF61C8